MKNSNQDKRKGSWNRAKGNVKESVGKLVGNQKLEAEGNDDQLKGQVQSALGNAKDAVKSVIKKTGNVLENIAEKVKESAN